MKKAIFALLFLCFTSLLAPASSIKFIALVSWALHLDAQAANWNQECYKKGEPPITCDKTKQVINQQLAFFISAANGFKSDETGCEGALQDRVIKHYVRLYSHDLTCRNTELTEATAECKKESDDIDVEHKTILQDLQACLGSL